MTRTQIAWASLRCPDCHAVGRLGVKDGRCLGCAACDARFPTVDGRPVLLKSSNALFDRDAYESEAARGIYSTRRLGWLPNPSVNLAQSRVLAALGSKLSRSRPAKVLVLGSGRQREPIRQQLAAGGAGELQLICVDVDATADVEIFADGHDLPFADGYFDAVITTAVLEHVLYPEVVAEEIARVVRHGGWVYSEMPFMQQVHEGAYDFTRYTLSGHRRLLHRFREIDAGIVAGPGTALVWAIEGFAGACFVSPRLSRLARLASRLLFFWLKYFDRILARSPAAADGASCTYILGERIEQPVSDAEIIATYRGARHVVHQ